jgi:hypothetical protein
VVGLHTGTLSIPSKPLLEWRTNFGERHAPFRQTGDALCAVLRSFNFNRNTPSSSTSQFIAPSQSIAAHQLEKATNYDFFIAGLPTAGRGIRVMWRRFRWFFRTVVENVETELKGRCADTCRYRKFDIVSTIRCITQAITTDSHGSSTVSIHSWLLKEILRPRNVKSSCRVFLPPSEGRNGCLQKEMCFWG